MVFISYFLGNFSGPSLGGIIMQISNFNIAAMIIASINLIVMIVDVLFICKPNIFPSSEHKKDYYKMANQY